MEFKSGLMDQNTRENGKMINLVVKVSFFIQMVMFMKVNGLLIKQMD